MEDKSRNRMATPEKRGRPTNDDLAEREAPVPVRGAFGEVEPVALPPMSPMLCLCCGRGQTPKVIRTNGHQRTVTCGLCAGRMLITYGFGKPPMAARIA